MYPYAFKCMIQKNGAKFATQHQLLHDLGQIRPNASKKANPMVQCDAERLLR